MSWQIEEGDNLYGRINGKSYRENNYVPLHTLRYLKMPHYNFDGQIQSMYLVDNYWTGDPDTTDSASIDKNNTPAFCYREITGGVRPLA